MGAAAGQADGVRTSAEIFVKRQSSSRVVGNPTAQNRENAASRKSRSQAGAPAVSFAKSVKASR